MQRLFGLRITTSMAPHPLILSILAAALLTSCATVGNLPDRNDGAPVQASANDAAQNSLEDLLKRMPGIYKNRQQYAAADESLKITPRVGDQRPWIDYQHAVFKRVDAPEIPGDVIALEWRKAGLEGDISRQRLWSFRLLNGQPVMDFYSLKTPVNFADPAVFGRLKMGDLISYGEKCALPIRRDNNGYRFSIPQTCRIITRSGRDMILSADIIFDGNIKYRESGRLVDGKPIFEVPGRMWYEFQRVSE